MSIRPTTRVKFIKNILPPQQGGVNGGDSPLENIFGERRRRAIQTFHWPEAIVTLIRMSSPSETLWKKPMITGGPKGKEFTFSANWGCHWKAGGDHWKTRKMNPYGDLFVLS